MARHIWIGSEPEAHCRFCSLSRRTAKMQRGPCPRDCLELPASNPEVPDGR